MKNFRKLISSTNRNNLRLFISLTIVALFAVTSLLLWQTTAQTQTAEQFSVNGIPLSTLGNYPNTTVTVGSNTTIAPDAVPTNTTRINISTNSNFKGLLAANATTGIIRITNAHPAGTYTITVKAFNSNGEMTTRTFTLTVGNGAICNGTVQFTNAPDVSSDAGYGVAIGDFNNDGNQDFAAAHGAIDTVSIHLGNGTGGFSGTTNVSVGDNPISVAIGDFNNDGNQDFAAANESNVSNSVSIRLGDGLGNFSGTTNVGIIGGIPSSVVIGDFNNDGNQDFAAGKIGASTVSIRLGDGLGNFSGTTEVSVGPNPIKLAIGDFNNDGNQDLAAANFLSGTVSIRLGDGSGNFSGITEVSVGGGPNGIAIGDFNNDGNQDFATINGSPHGVSVRLGNDAGGFSGTTEISLGNNMPFNLAIGDFNNDGNQDLAIAVAIIDFMFLPTVSIRLGNVSGDFTNTTAINVNGVFDLAIADFNNDNIQDFITTSSPIISIRLGNCLVTPTPTPSPTPTPGNVCTPIINVTEGDLFPGGIATFGVTSGAGSVTVDHVNAGTGLRSLTVVSATNAVVVIPPFTPGTTAPVLVTFTPINPGLAVDFTLRAASTFHAANIRARCAEVCTPSTTVTEGDLFPGGIVSFGISSGPGLVTVDHVNAGTGTQSLTVVGTPTNAVVNIPPFTIGTTMPVIVTFTPINPNQPVDFTLRAASTFHAANIRVRCGTLPPKPEQK